MVLEKHSKRREKKEKMTKAKFAYKNSRSVKVCSSSSTNKQTGTRNNKPGWLIRKMKRFPRNKFRKKRLACPGAPHNTTSFLINFHKRDSSNDLISKYGRREVPDLSDRYEVESVIQT